MSLSSIFTHAHAQQYQHCNNQLNLSNDLFATSANFRPQNQTFDSSPLVSATDASWTVSSIFTNLMMSNALFSGGLMLGMFGVILAYARFLMAMLWQYVVGMFVVRLEIHQTDECFVWMLQWLQTENGLRNHSGKHIEVRTVRSSSSIRRHHGTNVKPMLVFAQANNSVDWVRFRHNGVSHKIWVSRSQLSGPPTMGHTNIGEPTLEPRQSIMLSTIGRNTEVLRALCRSAMDESLRPLAGTVNIFNTLGYDGWALADPKARRQFSSVVLPRGQAQMLVNDAITFFSSEKWYAERGLPFRRGYLLEGKPGSGKSSTVFALASRLGLSICMLSLNTRHLDDATLARTFNTVPARSIVLLEDIDAAIGPRRDDDDDDDSKSSSKKRRQQSTSQVTLSGLLQALDGVASGEGRLLIMSTNCVEDLDPALIRAGRVDVRVTFGYATEEQIRRLFARFYWRANPATASVKAKELAVDDDNSLQEVDTTPVEDLDCCNTEVAKPFCDAFVAALGNDFQAPMALVQGHLLKHRNSPQDAIDQAQDLVKEAALALQHATKSLEKDEKEKAKGTEVSVSASASVTATAASTTTTTTATREESKD